MGTINHTTGTGGLPKITLAAPDGARAEVYLQGAQVTSWIPSGGDEQLFLSEEAVFKSGAAIRGGIPVIFPQFSSRGPLPKHGFARSQVWELGQVVQTGANTSAHFHLHDTQTTRQIWNFRFELLLSVAIGGDCLEVSLQVNNPGDKVFSFTAALHTYLQVTHISQTTVDGLQGYRFFDHTAGASPGEQTERLLSFSGEVDRVYPGAPARLMVNDRQRSLEVQARGFPDCVAWNPGRALAATLPDLGEAYHKMVCIEAAVAEHAVILEPGQSWQGAQTLIA